MSLVPLKGEIQVVTSDFTYLEIVATSTIITLHWFISKVKQYWASIFEERTRTVQTQSQCIYRLDYSKPQFKVLGEREQGVWHQGVQLGPDVLKIAQARQI